jgi:hypothetical protein
VAARRSWWRTPPAAPWRAAQPKYWNEPVADPVSVITMPAASNPAKGSGTLTPEEVEKARADERAAFAERLSKVWTSRVNHM